MNTYAPIFRGVDARGGRKLYTIRHTHTRGTATVTIIIEALQLNRYKRPKKHFKNEQRSKDAATKKDLIQVEYIGKINNYYEDIYIPPYNNTG